MNKSNDFFQSIGKPTGSSVTTLMRQVTLLIPFISIPLHLKPTEIFSAQPISYFLATILSLLLILKEFKNFTDKKEYALT